MTALPDQKRAFLAAIRAAPDDDAPRLAFADWLEDRGDGRGEFIRLQCKLARLDQGDRRHAELAAREAELLRRHERPWLEGLPQHVEVSFDRGMASVSARADALAKERAMNWFLAKAGWVTDLIKKTPAWLRHRFPLTESILGRWRWLECCPTGLILKTSFLRTGNSVRIAHPFELPRSLFRKCCVRGLYRTTQRARLASRRCGAAVQIQNPSVRFRALSQLSNDSSHH